MKSDDAEAALMRRELDDVFKKWRRVPTVAPKRGWVHTVREALCMTSSELARRMGISQAAVVALEQSEAKQTIHLATLRRAAKALDCNLVYALVPTKKSLEKTLDARRRGIAIADIGTVALIHSGEDMRELIKAYGKMVKRNRLWTDGGMGTVIQNPRLGNTKTTENGIPGSRKQERAPE